MAAKGTKFTKRTEERGNKKNAWKGETIPRL